MNNIVILDDDNNSPISLLSCKPVNKNETQYPVSMNSNTMNNAIDVSTDFHDNYMMAEIDSSLSGNISIKEQAVKALVEMSNKSKSEVQKIVNNCCSELLALKVVYNANTLIESCFEDVLQLPEIINLTSTNSASTVSLISNSDADLYLSKRQLVNRVLSIFPNAKMTHVEKLISDYSKDVNKVIQSMAEHGYEKEAKSSSSSQVQILDFNSLTSFEPSPQYKEQVMLLLQINFPYIKVADIKSMLSDPKFNYHYTLILRHLEKLLEVDANIIGVNDKNFHTLEMVMKKTSKLEELKIRIKKGKLSHINNYFDLLDNLDPILFDELTVIKQQKVKKSIENDRQMALKLNEEIAIEEGTLIECGCCYSEYCFEQMAQCSEGHLFCKECISRYVENTVFGEGKSLIKCMNTGKDACCGFYPDSMLQSALNEVVFAKYQEALARDVIKSAHLEVVTCFDCSFVAELAQDAGYIMACPRCNKETCRLCGEESHIPLKCSEVEKKGQTEVRLTVEEAMTQARVRECPKCKTRFYKTEGCNKMSCTCGTKICYICRADISKPQYTHFCQTPNCNHKSCGKCVLFSNAIEDDKLAMYEAGVKALESNKDEDSEDVAKIQLDKLIEGGVAPLRKPSNQNLQRIPPPVAIVVPPPIVFQPLRRNQIQPLRKRRRHK